MSKSRSFCFTFNNYDESTIDSLANFDARYLCYGKEIAPTTGTPHLQGFFYLRSPRGLKGLLADLPRGIHLEISKGTFSQNRAYCSKDGDFTERGEAPVDPEENGRREKRRWADIIDLARAGNFEELAASYPDVYANKLRTLEYLHARRPQMVDSLDGPGPFHQWIVGPTGCGKSSRARSDNPGAYVKEPECKWWDGYDHQPVAIIDDFDKYQVSQGGAMKRWLDRYPFPAEVKGGMIFIRPKKIVVTSQYYPEEIWEDQKTVDAIKRRVEIIDMYPPRDAFVATFNKSK